MNVKLVVVPEVEADISEAYTWYEDRHPGLGEEFLSCVDACIQSVCRMPDAYPRVHEQYRRALVRRFPFSVFFEHSNAVLTVFSVFHNSRDPQKWRARLP
jgi:plasmid stabilization system protein ParE